MSATPLPTSQGRGPALSLVPGVHGAADIPRGQTYRYRLDRSWSEGHGRISWIMLNPSTADAAVDDRTIRRCIGFSQAWGARCLTVVNLFALRSTDPAALTRHPDPVGPGNAAAIAAAIADTDTPVVAAWGAHTLAAGRVQELLPLLRSRPVACLAVTKSGAPAHPLYQRAGTTLRLWRPANDPLSGP